MWKEGAGEGEGREGREETGAERRPRRSNSSVAAVAAVAAVEDGGGGGGEEEGESNSREKGSSAVGIGEVPLAEVVGARRSKSHGSGADARGAGEARASVFRNPALAGT